MFRLGGLVGFLVLALAAYAPRSDADSSPWPFDQPPIDDLRQSPKKVFALYFPNFPLWLKDSNPCNPLPCNWSEDRYAHQYLLPAGLNNKYKATGGYIRERPLDAPYTHKSGLVDWELRNMEEEVRTAAALGLDGFALVVLSQSGPNFQSAKRMLQAAGNVDPGFKILLYLDMSAMTSTSITPSSLANTVKTLTSYPAAYRVDNRPVVAAHDAQNRTPSWWANWKATLQSWTIPVHFVPVFQPWRDYALSYKSVSFGVSDWGNSSALSNTKPLWTTAASTAHAPPYSMNVWMAPVRPQNMRPKHAKYSEAQAPNTSLYRQMWNNAIVDGADWVNITSWSDYSEHTEIEPSTGTQYAFYDLTAYYTAWFKTGVQPPIVRDVLYYFHRQHSTTAVPTQQPTRLQFVAGPPEDAPANVIELVAFLTEPGTLQVKIGANTYLREAGAGITQMQVPLAEGRPEFSLSRDGATVSCFTSAFPISNTITRQDLLYRGGSSSRPPVSGSAVPCGN